MLVTSGLQTWLPWTTIPNTPLHRHVHPHQGWAHFLWGQIPNVLLAWKMFDWCSVFCRSPAHVHYTQPPLGSVVTSEAEKKAYHLLVTNLNDYKIKLNLVVFFSCNTVRTFGVSNFFEIIPLLVLGELWGIRVAELEVAHKCLVILSAWRQHYFFFLPLCLLLAS